MQKRKIFKMIVLIKAAILVAFLMCACLTLKNINCFAAELSDELQNEIESEDILVENESIVSDLVILDNDEELYAEYVNSVILDSLEDDEILEQSEEIESISAVLEESDMALYGAEDASYTAQQGTTKSLYALSNLQRVIYDAMCEYVKGIAEGEISNSRLVVAFDSAVPDGDNVVYVNSPDAKFYYSDLGIDDIDTAKTLVKDEYIEIGQIVDTALYNNPYLFYWYDKVNGCKCAVSYKKSSSYIRIYYVTISMQVSKDYSDGNQTDGMLLSTDTSKTSAAKTAVANAKSVVDENAAKSDYEKLCAYRDYIYGAASYDYSVGSNSSYGNPWQLIYVFDEDSSTRVVCEGYAKAFKYLCDLSSFDSGIKCSLIGGYMSSGTSMAGHMWNVLSMDDGKNYLVDLTNSDSGTSGSGYLFLRGYTEIGTDNSAPESCKGDYYRYKASYNFLKYYPFEKMHSYYDGTTIMKLSKTDYVVDHLHDYINGYCEGCSSYQYEADIVLAGCSLTVGDKAVLHAFLSDDGNWSRAEDSYLLVVYPDGKKMELGVSDAKKQRQNKKDYLVFDCNLDMQMLSDEIELYFCNSDGNRFVAATGSNRGKTVEYRISVKDYASRLMQTNNTEAVKDCMQTVLLYGGAVQKARNYRTSKLASVGYTNQTAHILTLSLRDIKSLSNINPVTVQYFSDEVHPVEYRSIGMDFREATSMKIYLKTDSAHNINEFNYYVDDKKASLQKDSRGYYVKVEGIKPTNFAKIRTVTVKMRTDESVVLSVRASAYNWVYHVLDGRIPSDAALNETARYVFYLGRYGKINWTNE